MKLTILASALALCGGLALAQNPGTTTAKPQEKRATDMKDHKMTAEVVSTDATAQQITVRKLSMGGTSSSTEPADAPTFTLKVEGKALTRLSTVKAGDNVNLSCRPASASSATTSGSMSGGITSQAIADMHCSSVTDISAAKSNP
jgi:hypothetical protein